MSGSSHPKWTEEEEPAGKAQRNKSRQATSGRIRADAFFLSFFLSCIKRGRR